MATTSVISVTQALAEIKLIRSRLQNCLSGASFVVLKKRKDLLDADRFNTEARASYQSYSDLLKRYNQLKTAIVMSNATTRVKVGEHEYTVAEAVERKRSIEFERDLLEKMREQFLAVTREAKAHADSEQARVERLLTHELSKDSKTSVDVVKSLSDTFLAENKAEILDPLKISDLIAKMTRDIEEFDTKVDWILAESNGRTLITI